MDHALLELLWNSITDSPWEENLEELDHLTRSLDRAAPGGDGGGIRGEGPERRRRALRTALPRRLPAGHADGGPALPDHARLKSFSNWFRVSSTATGRPWGQYLTAPLITASGHPPQLLGAVFLSPFDGRLAGHGGHQGVPAPSGSARPPSARVPASSRRVASTSPAST